MRDITPQHRPVMSGRRSIDGMVSRGARPVPDRPVQSVPVEPRSSLSSYHPSTSRFIDGVVVTKRPLGQPAPSPTEASLSSGAPMPSQAMDIVSPRAPASATPPTQVIERERVMPTDEPLHQATEPMPDVLDSRPVFDDKQNETPESVAGSNRATAKPAKKKGGFFKNILANVAIVVAAFAVGISFFDQSVGMGIIAVASVAGIIFRLDSRYFFGSAVFALVMIPILSIMGRTDLSNNYAVYAFVLMVFGTVASIVELARHGRRQKKLLKNTSGLR